MLDVEKYVFNAEMCWFNKACSNYETSKCNRACPIYLQFYYLVNLAGIPKKLQYPENLQLVGKNDVKAYRRLTHIKNDIYNWVEDGNNLFLYSQNCGNGKTTWAIKLMLKFFVEIYEGNGLNPQGFFIQVDSFLFKAKDNIGNKNERFNLMKELIPVVPMVIWDDIGVSGLTEYEQRLLYIMINERIINGKSNIFTSNLAQDQLEELIGGRLYSRIVNNSTCIEFNNPDQRGKEIDE